MEHSLQFYFWQVLQGLIFAVGPVSGGIYLLKVNNRNTKARCEICSKLIIKTLERRRWRCSGVFIVNFEHISHLVLVFLLVNFEHVIAGWGVAIFRGSLFSNQITLNLQTFSQKIISKKICP